MPADISVGNQHGERIKLDRLEASKSRLTLGVERALDGNSEGKYKKLLAASKKCSAHIIKSGRLTIHNAWHAMSSSIWKMFEYTLPATTFSLEQCEKIMAPVLTAGMTNSHICRHFAKDLIHGPASELRGGIPHLYILQGILHIEALIGHSGQKVTTSQLAKASMEALILEMGVGEEITDLRHRRVVEASASSWIGFAVDFMMENGLQLQHDIVLSLYCQHDQYITKAFALNRATTGDLEAAIRCRLFKGIVFVGNFHRVR
jgi:hypothetical protein